MTFGTVKAETPVYIADEYVVIANSGTNYQVQQEVTPEVYEASSHFLADVRIYGHNDGYQVVNFGYENSCGNIDYSMVLQNIFDDDGRVLASSVDVPGRSVVLSVAYNF